MLQGPAKRCNTRVTVRVKGLKPVVLWQKQFLRYYAKKADVLQEFFFFAMPTSK